LPLTQKLVATSVVRGSRQGESHGGVYLVDFTEKTAALCVDWNTADIDWQGRGWDRGLRGIAFDGERVYIAASDELFVYDPGFRLLESFRSPYLKHCHEICVHQRRLYLTSTGFDSILGFDLDNKRFCWGIHIARLRKGFQGKPFDPVTAPGPAPSNNFHLNSVYATDKGLFISGLKTGAVLVYNGREIVPWVSLPGGTHNARPHLDGVLFNDTQADRVRWVSPGGEKSFAVPAYPPEQLTHVDEDDSRIARAGFGRGLCAISDQLLAAGSSPSTIALHDLDELKTIGQVTLSYDIRNAIHGLEVWPF
jgi:hypothetical protein